MSSLTPPRQPVRFADPHVPNSPQRRHARQPARGRQSYQPLRTTPDEESCLGVPLQDFNSDSAYSSRSPSYHGNCQSNDALASSRSGNKYRLKPIHPPQGTPPLDWQPFCLRPKCLWFNALLCTSIAGCILAILYGTGSDRQALLTSENAHLLSTYAPTLIAALNLMCFRSTLFEAFRMLPYCRMADQNGSITQGATAAKSVGGSYFPWIFVSYGDDKWLKLFTQAILLVVGVLTTFKSVYLGSQKVAGGWILTVHQRPAFYLVGAYSSMAITYLAIWIFTRGRVTGLKWDVASPLDGLALVWKTNALTQITHLPISYRHAYKVLPSNSRWRIGYWQRIDTIDGVDHDSIIHGIGTIEHVNGMPCKDEGSCLCGTEEKCTYDRLLYPPFTSEITLSVLLVGLLLFIGVCIWIIVRGLFVNGIDLSGGWLLLDSYNETSINNTDVLSAENHSGNFIMVAGQYIEASDSTTANILFRALPTLIAGIYSTGIIEGLDRRLRDTQCFSELATSPKTSSQSLALDYATQFSFLVPVAAAERRHFRLALVAFVATFAPLCPVFVAGLVIFERTNAETLHLTISKPALIMVLIYLGFYIAATFAAWPRKTELLLRPVYSFADLVKPFADSRMLEDSLLDEAMHERTQEKFRARVLLLGYFYQLGLIRGTCGTVHRGIDKVGTEKVGIHGREIVDARKFIEAQKQHRKNGGQNWLMQHVEISNGDFSNLVRTATIRA